MTQQNVFVRKFGKLAIVITVTDWKDFKELEAYSKAKDPDFLISSTTTSSMYSNFQPCMQLNLFTAKDITEDTKGAGLDGILTGGSNAGPIWAYKKCGLTYTEEISKPQL